ncbi:MAG: hypothetical protein M0R49_03665 [Limnochordia bacterium]|nr:hypothetical protein [Limnochordia bacterium]
MNSGHLVGPTDPVYIYVVNSGRVSYYAKADNPAGAAGKGYSSYFLYAAIEFEGYFVIAGG